MINKDKAQARSLQIPNKVDKSITSQTYISDQMEENSKTKL